MKELKLTKAKLFEMEKELESMQIKATRAQGLQQQVSIISRMNFVTLYKFHLHKRLLYTIADFIKLGTQAKQGITAYGRITAKISTTVG